MNSVMPDNPDDRTVASRDAGSIDAEPEVDTTPDPGEASNGGSDASYVTIAGRRFRVPGSPVGRLTVGGLLIVGGVLGFLPVLGFWMIPLGLVMLSVDLPAIRRRRRRMDVWVGRRVNGLRGNGGNGAPGDAEPAGRDNAPGGDREDAPRT